MSVRILVGDVRAMLATLPDESVHTVVTSPPYWGLRDYGTASWEGGDPACDHRGTPKPRQDTSGSTKRFTETRGEQPGKAGYWTIHKETCGKCGARRVDNQIGLESSPAEFVATMVEVFREVRRVLRADGTCWVNLGDSYAGSGRGGYAGGKGSLEGSTDGQDGSRVARGSQLTAGLHAGAVDAGVIARAWVPPPAGLKQKDLVGIPWRVAFALQADGWYLRQDIIWSKPNPMPESVTDRCTKSHEYIFMLSKSARYFYDQDAIKELGSLETGPRLARAQVSEQRSDGVPGQPAHALHAPRDKQRGHSRRHAGFNDRWDAMEKAEQCTGMRNKRSVWTVTTQPFKEAHFATFPPALIEPCILAGCPVGGSVLDPFGGAGTTGLVADRHGRDAILIELNPEYAAMAERRIKGDSPLFAEVT